MSTCGICTLKFPGSKCPNQFRVVKGKEVERSPTLHQAARMNVETRQREGSATQRVAARAAPRGVFFTVEERATLVSLIQFGLNHMHVQDSSEAERFERLSDQLLDKIYS